MNTVKVGDKVRFLNTTGGGIVRSFKGKDQVLVEDEDGFEVPALIRECVVVGGEMKCRYIARTVRKHNRRSRFNNLPPNRNRSLKK